MYIKEGVYFCADCTAAAPEQISTSSVVIAAWRPVEMINKRRRSDKEGGREIGIGEGEGGGYLCCK